MKFYDGLAIPKKKLIPNEYIKYLISSGQIMTYVFKQVNNTLNPLKPLRTYGLFVNNKLGLYPKFQYWKKHRKQSYFKKPDVPKQYMHDWHSLNETITDDTILKRIKNKKQHKYIVNSLNWVYGKDVSFLMKQAVSSNTIISTKKIRYSKKLRFRLENKNNISNWIEFYIKYIKDKNRYKIYINI